MDKVLHTSGYSTGGIEVSTVRVGRNQYATAIGFGGEWSDSIVDTRISDARYMHDAIVDVLQAYWDVPGVNADRVVRMLRDVGAHDHKVIAKVEQYVATNAAAGCVVPGSVAA